MKRPVWSHKLLPTHSHGLRDGLLFWLLGGRWGFDTWLLALGCAAFLLLWVGEMLSIGNEDANIALTFKGKSDESSS